MPWQIATSSLRVTPVLMLVLLLVLTMSLPACSDPAPVPFAKLFEAEVAVPENVAETIRAIAAWKRTQPGERYYLHHTFKRPAERAEEYASSGLKVRSNPPLTVTPPIDWAANPGQDNNWLYQKNATYVLMPFLQLLQQGDAGQLDVAQAVLLDWIEYHERHDNPFQWYDMGAGIRATNLALVLDHALRREPLDLLALERLLRAAHDHARELGDPSKLAPGNHAYFQLLGIKALCRSVSVLEVCGALDPYASEEMSKLVMSQFTAEGVQR